MEDGRTAGGGTFLLRREARQGIVVVHAGTGVVAGAPRALRSEQAARKYVDGLKTIRYPGGAPFDWDSPGVSERIAAYVGEDGGTFRAETDRVWQRTILDPADRKKPVVEDRDAPFATIPELRVHLRSRPPEAFPERRGRVEYLRLVAEDPALCLSERGQLLLWSSEPGVWAIAAAASAFQVLSTIASAAAALELANWLEATVVDSEGRPAQFGTRDFPTLNREWRSNEGATLQEAVTIAQGDLYEARVPLKGGADEAIYIQMAHSVRESIATRRAIAERAAAGGYTVDRAGDLVKGDTVEWDVKLDSEARRRLAGKQVPGIGVVVTLRGTLADHAVLKTERVWLPFAASGLSWTAASGSGGQVVSDGLGPRFDRGLCWWRLDGSARTSAIIFRRRDPHIDAAGRHTWTDARADELARAHGFDEEQLAVLRAAVDADRGNSIVEGIYRGYALEAAAGMFDAATAALDRAPMAVLARLDEYAARGRLGSLAEDGDRDGATTIAAVAAERRRRRLRRPHADYVAGRAYAHALLTGDLQAGHVSASTQRGARDYAEARVAAIGNWLASVRTPEVDADGTAWRAVLDRLR
jgi:hypothetical protein